MWRNKDATYEGRLYGDFDKILQTIDKTIIHGSSSASCEGSSDFHKGDVRLAVRIYERYSIIGSNRVSMNVTLLQSNDLIFISAMTSGGSQAMFFKINTFGEDAFLEKLLTALTEFEFPTKQV